MSSVHHVFNEAQLQYIVASPVGPVAKDLLKRGARVELRAKRNLQGGVGKPRRIDTGHLRASVGTNLLVRPDGLAVRVGTGVHYALYVHDGTGLYGPKHTVIRPRHGKVLVFRSKIYGAKKGRYAGKVVVTFVRGMKPNPFLRDALPAFHSSAA